MKQILLIISLVLLISCKSAKTTPPQALTNPQPSNVIATLKQISGNADPKSTVKVKITGAVNSNHSIVVNHKGYFELKFNPALIQDTNGNNPIIEIWAEYLPTDAPQPVKVAVLTPQNIEQMVLDGTINLPNKNEIQLSNIINPDIRGIQPRSTTYTYDVNIVNTNFTIPIIRFNTIKDDNSKFGDVLLFNSIGAGVGWCSGELTKTTDANGETIDTDFKNNLGFHLGVLFSAGSSGSENKNVFAPTASISKLDFQLGLGYELGSVVENQNRVFITVAYAIPLSKLTRGKYYVKKASKGYNNTNPLKDDDAKTLEVKNTFL